MTVIAVFMIVLGLQAAATPISRPLKPATTCSLVDDPFCSDLENVRRAEERWRQLDAQLDLQKDWCDPSSAVLLNNARVVGAERYRAYRDYYEHWRSHARQQEAVFRNGAATQEASVENLKTLINSAQREYETLLQRRRTLGPPAKDSMAQRALDRLIALVIQRQENLREALAKRLASRIDSQKGRLQANEIADEASALKHLVAAEGRLWDAYYDGRQTRLKLQCFAFNPKN
jgi:hypothetical protein